jgi:hypothetical protein
MLKLAIIGCGFCTGIIGHIVFVNMTYFQVMFPKNRPEFVLPLLNELPQVFAQLLSLKYVNQLSLKCGQTFSICFQILLVTIFQAAPYYLGTVLCQTPLAWWITSISLASFVFYSVPIKLLMFGFIASFDEK